MNGVNKCPWWILAPFLSSHCHTVNLLSRQYGVAAVCPFQVLVMKVVRSTETQFFFGTSHPLHKIQRQRHLDFLRRNGSSSGSGGSCCRFRSGSAKKSKIKIASVHSRWREESNKLSQIQPENMNRTFQSISNIAICYYAPVAQILILHTKT